MEQEYITGGWVRLLIDYCGAKKGEILQITRVVDEKHVMVDFKGHQLGSGLLTTNWSGTHECEWVGMEKPGSGNSLLEEARRRFPIGTSFKSAQSGNEYVVEGTKFRIDSNNNIDVDGVPYVHWHGKWAEIVKTEDLPQEVPSAQQWIPKEGDWVEIQRGDSNWASEMDKYIGRIVQLTEKSGSDGFKISDCGSWHWTLKDKHFKKAFAPKESIDLLAEAKRRFPVGTKYKTCGDIYTVEEQNFELKSNGDVRAEYMKGWLCMDGKWIEIIETTAGRIDSLLPEAAKKYPVGSKYKGIKYNDVEEAICAPKSNSHGIYVGTDYVYLYSTGKWAEVITQSDKIVYGAHFERVIPDERPSAPLHIKDIVEPLPGEIIVKRKEKVVKRLIMA